MNVKDLIAYLSTMPLDAEVYVEAPDYERNGLIPAWLEHYGKGQGPSVKEFAVISYRPDDLKVAELSATATKH